MLALQPAGKRLAPYFAELTELTELTEPAEAPRSTPLRREPATSRPG